MWLEKLFSSLQHSIALASKKLKCLVRLRNNTLVSKRELFKWAHWTLFERASYYNSRLRVKSRILYWVNIRKLDRVPSIIYILHTIDI